MNKITRQLARVVPPVAAGIALGLAVTGPALADDTEILVGNQLDPGDPNVLFIIDTSGSMSSDVVVGVDFDPEATYEGTCDSDRIYWVVEDTGTISVPDCVSNRYIENASYRCLAGHEIIGESGQFRDRHAQWDDTLEPHSWTAMTLASSDPTLGGSLRITECAADDGLHGDTAGEFYPADGANGPWTSDANNRVDWDATGNLYTFFSGNYLNWIQETGRDTTVKSRMQVVQRVASDVLTPLNNVNVGLMRFSTNAQGGMVLHEIVPIDDGKDDILTAIDSLSPQGATTLAETLYEAGQYYGGRAVDFGVESEGTGGNPLPSVPESQNDNGFYDSPITRQCQRSYVVLLTDGLPVGDTDADERIQDLPGFSGTCIENCLDELAIHLSTTDLRPGGGLPDPQTVKTFTIGFHTDQQLLEQAATGQVPVLDEDGQDVLDDDNNPVTRPGYFIANDQQQLARAFEDIIETIQSETDTFSAPALSIDTQNRLTNRDELYFAMFEPPTRGEPLWHGNLKKYRIGRTSGAGANTIPTIIDASGQPAVGEDGLFLPGARSIWSLDPDEGNTTSGGFAGTLTTNRNIYTNISGSQLNATGNKVHETNTDLTAAMLGVNEDDRAALLQWARGLNTDGITARKAIGDPLHSAPTLLAYSGDRYALFFGTNDGFLHAIDPEPATDGVTDIEHFAFIPRELLPELAALKRNAPQPQYSAQKAYGLDGDITVWIDESNNNGVVEGTEKAYLYVGMRRGGRNYYAIDVTDVSDPRLKWSITGGTGDFVELGQSWSAPTPARIRWGGVEKQVLFFAGGNDTNQDARNRPASADDMGRAIYMVDALTGTRLWWAGVREAADLTLEDMTHSIPSDLRVIDMNQDGLMDRIYVGDTGGKLWRFDINNDSGTLTGDVFADLGGDGESGNRRMYSPPSITRIFDEEFGTFLTIAVGTGHRAHPLENDVNDGFFLLRDLNVFAAPVNPDTQMISYPDPILIDDLLDVTPTIAPAVADLNSARGWFIDFDDGEKSLSAALTVLDRIFFTTYIPSPPATACQPVPILGSGRLYSVSVLSGSPIQADATVPDDRHSDVGSSGIPPTPTLVFTPPPCDPCDADDPVSEITMLIGTQAIDPGITNVAIPTYWVQEDIDR